MKHRPDPIPPGNDDHRAVGEYSDVLHFLPAEHSRTDAQHFTGVAVDELGKVIGEDLAVSLHQQPVPGKPAKFQPLAHAGQGGNAAPPGVHVQVQQAFFHPPLAAYGVDHGNAACAGNGNGLGEMVVSIQRKGVFCYLAVFPAVDLPLVPLVGKVDPAQPVRHNAAMVFGAPSVFRQSPVFHIPAGAPVGQFDPCSVGGIPHPEGMVHPAKGAGRTVISNGGRFGPVEGGWVLAQQCPANDPAAGGSGRGIEFIFCGISKAPKVRQAVGADHLGRTAVQIGHTAVFPFLRVPAFPLARREIPCQRIEEIIVLILKDIFLAGHLLPRVLLPGMVAPFSPLLFHQVAILPLLFAVAFPFAAFFLRDQGKQILVLIVQVIQRPAEGRKFLSQRCRPFFMGQFHILNANGIKAFIQQRRDLRAPFFSQFRQSVLYGSVKFQNVQRILYDLFELCHR